MELNTNDNYTRIKDTLKSLYFEGEDYIQKRERIEALKKSGKLDIIFKEKILDDFKEILKEFISLIESPDLEDYHYYRKYLICNANKFVRCASRFKCEFNVFFNNEELTNDEIRDKFGGFPNFFKNSCKLFNIEPYASMDIEELHKLLLECVNLAADKKLIDPNKNRTNSPFNGSIFAKNLVLKKLNSNRLIEVMDYGDGYGYDILLIDEPDKKEKLIKIKSSYDNDSFILTRYEHKIMLETCDIEHSDYYIYKVNKSVGSLSIFKYDKEHNILVDINDENHICVIEGYFTHEREGRASKYPRIKFKCLQKRLNKDKTYTLEKQM